MTERWGAGRYTGGMETAPTPISSDELARDLPGVLRRVRKHGERFVITCDGETADEMLPARKFASPEEVAAKLEGLEWPDEEFASDAAWVKENQPRTPSARRLPNTRCGGFADYALPTPMPKGHIGSTRGCLA